MMKVNAYNAIPRYMRTWFNCGGFALQTLDWLQPELPGCHDYYDKAELPSVTEDCVEQLLETFPGQLRVIDDPRKRERYEEIVLFRVSSDRDFHFMVQHGNTFYHKQGSRTVLRKTSIHDAYNTVWDGRYDGPIVIFAKLKTPCHYMEDYDY